MVYNYKYIITGTPPIYGVGIAQSVQWRATGWTAQVQIPAVQNFLFFTASRPTLESSQPPIQWIPGTLSPGV
jgi:hypothetical protein